MDERIDSMARKVAAQLQPGMLVNLGIGLPTYIPNVLGNDLGENHGVWFHSENGFVGMGHALEGGTPDNDVIDAGGRACTLREGAACFDSSFSFGIVRSGRLDVAVLGAFEIGINGDLANWIIPGKLTPGMGGAMELAQKAKRVIVMSYHLNKKGRSKLVKRCQLPITAPGCVDTLITERAMFCHNGEQLELRSVAPGYSVDDALAGIDTTVRVADQMERW